MGLIEKVNRNLPAGMHVEQIPGFYRGRSCLRISDEADIRKQLHCLSRCHTEVEETKFKRNINDLQYSKLWKGEEYLANVQKLFSFGIRTIALPSEFEDYYKKGTEIPFTYVCRDWVFDKLGKPELTRREDKVDANELLRKDLSDIVWTPTPQVGDIVAYFNPDYGEDGNTGYNLSDTISHYGLVSDIQDGIRVMSKWDEQSVYEHPLALVPKIDFGMFNDAGYGDFVYFFRVLSSYDANISRQ